MRVAKGSGFETFSNEGEDMSRTQIIKCDIENKTHNNHVVEIGLQIIFDHDQEDGQSTVKPYFEFKKLDICDDCLNYLFENKRYVYGYGAMGYNKYYLK